MVIPKTKRPKAVSLSTLRQALSKTQVLVAAESEMAQGDVSRLEGREDLDGVSVATLRRYVEGLGGELRLVAVIRRKTYELRGAPSDPPKTNARRTK